MRIFVSAAWVGLFLAAGARGESYALKFREWPEGAGQSVAVRQTQRKVMRLTTKDGDKEIEVRKREEIIEEAYTQKVKKGEPRPMAYERTYRQAQRSVDGKKEKRGYAGRTIVFAQEDGHYRVRVEGKPDLAPADLNDLSRQANPGRKRGEPSPFAALVGLLPARAVKVGETWTISGAALGKLPNGALFDSERSKGEGKLVRVYRAGGKRFAVVAIQLRRTVRATKASIRVSPVEWAFTLDLALDSPTFVGKATLRVRSTVAGHFPSDNPPGTRTTHFETITTREVRRMK
jgi:hypothetical protein